MLYLNHRKGTLPKIQKQGEKKMKKILKKCKEYGFGAILCGCLEVLMTILGAIIAAIGSYGIVIDNHAEFRIFGLVGIFIGIMVFGFGLSHILREIPKIEK